MRESEQERKSFAYGIKIAPDSRGLVLPWRIFTFQSGAIGKSTSLSHLNSVKPCPAQIENMDPSMLHQNRRGRIQPIKTQTPVEVAAGGWGWLSIGKHKKNVHDHSAKRQSTPRLNLITSRLLSTALLLCMLGGACVSNQSSQLSGF